MHLCPHCCCTTMTALPQTGSDTGIRTQDLRDMSPTRTTSPPYRNKLAGSQGFEPCTCRLTADRTCLMCFLPKFGGLYWIPTSHRSIGILPDSDYRLLRTQGTPIEPLSLQVQKLVERRGFEPPMFTLWERIYSPLQHHRRCRLSSKANHIVHKIQNLVRHVGFEPTTLWSQTRCATRLR